MWIMNVLRAPFRVLRSTLLRKVSYVPMSNKSLHER